MQHKEKPQSEYFDIQLEIATWSGNGRGPPGWRAMSHRWVGAGPLPVLESWLSARSSWKSLHSPKPERCWVFGVVVGVGVGGGVCVRACGCARVCVRACNWWAVEIQSVDSRFKICLFHLQEIQLDHGPPFYSSGNGTKTPISLSIFWSLNEKIYVHA